MFTMQNAMDGWNFERQRDRARTQMTLGKLIDTLKDMPEGSEVANLCEAHSYRGYYSDLAFERKQGTRLASELLEECKNSMGAVFEGYKGGDFVMGALTPLWVANYGCSGKKIISISVGGGIETAEDE